MTPENWTYLSQLVRAMRQCGIRGERIGERVAEIADHLEESGADPVAEFGRPIELAERLAVDEKLLPVWARSLVVQLAGMSLAMIGAAVGTPAFFSPAPVTVELGQVLWAVVFGALIMVVGWLGVRHLDGKSWESGFAWWWFPVIILGVWVGQKLQIGLHVALFTATRAVAATVGIVFAAVGLSIASMYSSRVRFPPGAEYLKPLRRGPFSGSSKRP
jgi:hypothetical protein